MSLKNSSLVMGWEDSHVTAYRRRPNSASLGRKKEFPAGGIDRRLQPAGGKRQNRIHQQHAGSGAGRHRNAILRTSQRRGGRGSGARQAVVTTWESPRRTGPAAPERLLLQF